MEIRIHGVEKYHLFKSHKYSRSTLLLVLMLIVVSGLVSRTKSSPYFFSGAKFVSLFYIKYKQLLAKNRFGKRVVTKVVTLYFPDVGKFKETQKCFMGPIPASSPEEALFLIFTMEIYIFHCTIQSQ